MTIPKQQPGKSKQDWQTPPELLKAIRKRLHIENFILDVAASNENAVCDFYLTEEDDALSSVRSWINTDYPKDWVWCNPPYNNIPDWVYKAVNESSIGAHIAMLIPSSVGSNWWRDWVEPYAYILHLNGRIKFVGAKDYYPKDCSLLLYTPMRLTGSQIWNWKNVT